jgi:hypothetical protein
MQCIKTQRGFGIGASQFKSKKPVGCYTGIPPLKEEQLRDVAECAAIIAGIFAMMWYHNRLEKPYRM